MNPQGENQSTIETGPHEQPARLHFGHWRRLPIIRQVESAECGLACLAMIASYHGSFVDLAALRRQFSLSLKGVTVIRLMEMAHSLGLICRPVRLELEEISRLQTPSVLHWDFDHFVVLRQVRKHHIVLHDPAMGLRTIDLADFARHFTGVAVEFSKGPEFRRRQPPPPVSLRELAGSIHGLGRSLLQVFIMALLLELFALLTPLFMQTVVDQVLTGGDRDLLALLGVSFLLLLVIQTVVSALRTWTLVWLSTHFNHSWIGNVFRHLLSLPQDYFLKRHLGDIVSRFGAISTIQQTLTTQFVDVILDGLLAVLTLAMLFFYSPVLTVFTMAALLLYAILRLLYFQIYRESNLNQIVATARQQSSFMETVRGVQTLRLHNRGVMQTSRYLNATTEALNTSVAVQKLNLAFGSLHELVGGAQRIGVLWLGAWLALRGQFTAGALVAFVAYVDQFTGRSARLIDYLIQLRLLRLQAERLADIVLTPPEPFAEGSYVGPMPSPSIRFEHVSYRYADGEAWILANCNFEIAAGESVAIVGPSGCGKSTLIKLMLGLLDPLSGTIKVGGVDLKHLGKTRYRQMVGSVMQDDRLFAGSIADNISFFDNDAKPERIEAAARLADLHDDVVAMPMGYHSLVGDMGSSLSGGQQQRLFLARVFYRNPEILVLDEATSHLDVACERRISNALRKLKATWIVIAHRPESIRSAHRVLLMNAGVVREIPLSSLSSTHAESGAAVTPDAEQGESPCVN